jgi:bifunctional enzyme CysN/CysC
VPVRLEKISRIIDASDLSYATKNLIERHDVAECELKLSRAIAFDLVDTGSALSRFVIVDEYEIAGGGIITGSVDDKQAWVRDKVILRNYKWEKSSIVPEIRNERYNQKSCLILITGKKDTGKKALAKALEKKLFDEGKLVYFLGIGNVLYGVDADIKDKGGSRTEHIRRLAEVAHILLDAGIILIVTAIELNQEDLETIKTTIDSDKIECVWVGDDITTDISFDKQVHSIENIDEVVGFIKEDLQDKSIIFRVW